jgi:hypothetical protein
MSRRFTWLCGTFFIALAISGSRAEVPPLNPGDLKDMSTHTVVGKLRMVYRSVEMHGDFQYTHGIAEIAVEKVEKGVGPKGGEVVYVRFWNDIWTGKGPVPPHSDGHHVPMQGAVVRAYVKRNHEGSYESLLPNGLEVVAESTTRPR